MVWAYKYTYCPQYSPHSQIRRPTMRELTAILCILAVHYSQSKAIIRKIREKPVDSYGPPTDQPAIVSGPYPPSGWAPSGDLLLLPGETHSSQQNNYGPPPPSVPDNQYGPAQSSTEASTTTTEPNQDPDASEGSESQIGDPNNENGQYYVFLPDGKLQKVQYSGKQRGRGQYEAQVQYEEVDPVRAPVYSYPNLPLQIPF